MANSFKYYIFSIVYFLLFASEFTIYFLTYSEAITGDAYFNLFTACLWFLKAFNQVSSKPTVKNTFGWSRMHEFGILFVTTFTSALYFSVSVNSLQNMYSSKIRLNMYYEKILLIFGGAGFIIDFIVFIASGTDTKFQYEISTMQKQCLLTFKFDFDQFIINFTCSLLLLLCALINLAAKGFIRVGIIDSIIALFITALQVKPLWLLCKDNCKVLFQCIPDKIDLNTLKNEFKEKFPNISLHHVHLWTLTENHLIFSGHLEFFANNHKEVENTITGCTNFLKSYGITRITLQYENNHMLNNINCEYKCPEDCKTKQCCNHHLTY